MRRRGRSATPAGASRAWCGQAARRARRPIPTSSRSTRWTIARSAQRRARPTSFCTRSTHPIPTGHGSLCRSPIPPSLRRKPPALRCYSRVTSTITAGRGRLTYPGPLEVVHEWAYLPDVAATLPRLAAIRETLPPFATFGFSGHAVTGREFTGVIAAATRSKLQVDRMTWWLIHALRPIVPLCRELSEIAYL